MSNYESDILNNKHILLIEDDYDVREILKCYIEYMGTDQITLASNGQDALTLLHEDNLQFDLIISDQNMSKLSGVELLEKIKENNSKHCRTPFILMSGFFDPKLKCTLEKAKKAQGFLEKPFTYQELFALVGKIYDHKSYVN